MFARFCTFRGAGVDAGMVFALLKRHKYPRWIVRTVLDSSTPSIPQWRCCGSCSSSSSSGVGQDKVLARDGPGSINHTPMSWQNATMFLRRTNFSDALRLLVRPPHPSTKRYTSNMTAANQQLWSATTSTSTAAKSRVFRTGGPDQTTTPRMLVRLPPTPPSSLACRAWLTPSRSK